ncbi:MAG: DUF503 domain-containing protein [Planctomycetota bacterium]|nr:MAG: DUF503 domain-containing protein [Planctomycetota bacterium]
MIVGTLEIQLIIRHAQSLKDKRRAIHSLKSRIRNKFNVSIAEIDKQNYRQQAVLGIACVGNDTQFLHSILSKILQYIRRDAEVELAYYQMETY